MILTCPTCASRYIVPDSAIGASGRQVRCAACRHSWFQQGVEIRRPEPVAQVAMASEGAGNVAVAEAPPVAPSVAPAPSGPAPFVAPPSAPAEPAPQPVAARRTQDIDAFAGASAPQVPDEEAVEAAPAVPASAEAEPQPAPAAAAPASVSARWSEDEISAAVDDYVAPEHPRRNPAKYWMAAAVAFFLAVSAGGAALWAVWPPEWAVNLGLVPGAEANGLSFMPKPDHVDRHKLATGEELFTFSSRIVNNGTRELPVPPVVVELRDAQGRLVFSWLTKADAARLKPGEVARVSESRLDIPRNAQNLALRFN